jgi:aldehyde dehydrogenase family protein
MKSYQDEIFGPVLQIIRAETFEEALSCPNVHRSISFSGKSLSVGYLPERGRLARCKPVAQSRAQLANALNAMDACSQFRT